MVDQVTIPKNELITMKERISSLESTIRHLTSNQRNEGGNSLPQRAKEIKDIILSSRGLEGDDSEWTIRQIASLMNLTHRETKKTFQALEREGFLVRITGKKGPNGSVLFKVNPTYQS